MTFLDGQRVQEGEHHIHRQVPSPPLANRGGPGGPATHDRQRRGKFLGRTGIGSLPQAGHQSRLQKTRQQAGGSGYAAQGMVGRAYPKAVPRPAVKGWSQPRRCSGRFASRFKRNFADQGLG